MARFLSERIKSNQQEAMAYIAYMMIGSYFKTSEMESCIMEQRMLMNYRLLSPKKQEEKEEYVDMKVRKLAADYLAKISGLKCRVHVKQTFAEERLIWLWFETGFEELLAVVDLSGKVTVRKIKPLKYHGWMKLGYQRMVAGKTANGKSAGNPPAKSA